MPNLLELTFLLFDRGQDGVNTLSHPKDQFSYFRNYLKTFGYTKLTNDHFYDDA